MFLNIYFSGASTASCSRSWLSHFSQSQSLRKGVNLLVGLFHLLLIVVRFGFEALDLAVCFSLRLVQRDIQFLQFACQVVFVFFPVSFIFLIPGRQLNDLVFLDFHCCLLVLLLGRQVEFVVLHITALVLQFCELFL